MTMEERDILREFQFKQMRKRMELLRKLDEMRRKHSFAYAKKKMERG